MPTSFRLLAVDLDGTLLDSNSTIPPDNQDAMRAAMQAGVIVCICTGRGFHSVVPYVSQIDSESVPLVLRNGAFVKSSLHGELWHQHLMSGDLARSALHAYRDAGLRPVVCIEDGDDADLYLMDPTGMDETERQFYHSFHPMIREAEGIFATPFHHASVVGAKGDRATLETLRDHILKDLKLPMTMHVFSLPGGIHYLEGHMQGTTKWDGIQELLRRYEIAPEQVMVIGDAINDLSMISQAGLGIAMKDSDPQCLKAAREIAPSNDACGVAAMIHKHLLP